MDSNDLERERGITILAKADLDRLEGHPHQHRRHAGPRRFRRRGRAHPQHGRRRAGAGRRRRRPAAADQVRGLQGAQDGPQADRRDQQGRPSRRARRPKSLNEVFDLFAALDATDEQLDFPILYGSAKQGWMATTPRRPEGRRHEAAVRAGAARTCRRRRSKKARSACSAPSSKPTPISAASSPAASPPARVKPNQTAKVLDRDGKLIETGPHHQGAGLPRPRARAARRSRSRRHRRRSPACRKPPSRTPSARPTVETPLPAQPIDPPTLAMTFRVNDSPLAGTEGSKVTSRMIRDRLLREAEGNVALRVREIRRQGRDGSRRPRRIAARHPDRDHAPRRLRALGVAAEGAAAHATRRANWKSRSRKSSSTSTRSIPASSCRRCPSARPT